MNILNIGTDKTLVGGKKFGDTIERHRRYGEYLDHLDIIVYTNKKEGLKKFEISDKVIGYPSNSKSKLHFFFDAKKIFKKINQDYKIDIIVCQDPFIPGLIGVCLKKKYGVKLQINFHGDFWRNKNWLKEHWINILFLLISKFTVPKADTIRVMSQGQKEKLGKYKDKARVISVPVDIDKYQRSEILPTPRLRRANRGQRSEVKTVLHVGRDDIVKDYRILIQVFKIVKDKIPEVRFVQAGADREIKKEMDYVEVELKGRLNSQDLINIYHSSDIVILSSTSESFGKVLVEANACGKPVVSTATTGAKEIIRDGVNGFLAPIGDAEALAEKIVYLLENSDKAREMGENGRKLVEEKYGDNIEKIINLWKELIENKSKH